MNKQLTVMQELRQRILIRYPHGAEDMTDEMKDMQSWLIEEIDLAFIPKEKEQIEKAAEWGITEANIRINAAMNMGLSEETTPEQYYQNTYQNN